jgi:hypothetical protein
MDSVGRNPRIELIRETAVLQIKLLVDGLRDAVLIPVSLGAALIGLLRGGPDCSREFKRVLKIGRRSERWINLFGHHRPAQGESRTGSMDSILEQVEIVVKDQYQKKRGTTENTEQNDPPD